MMKKKKKKRKSVCTEEICRKVGGRGYCGRRNQRPNTQKCPVKMKKKDVLTKMNGCSKCLPLRFVPEMPFLSPKWVVKTSKVAVEVEVRNMFRSLSV